jgi:hypothetical protein
MPVLALRAMWTLPLVLLAALGAMAGRDWTALAAADDSHIATILMEVDRPLGSFARQFRERHGISVTYEDPLDDAAAWDVSGAGADGSAGGGAPAAAGGDAVKAIWLSVSYRVSVASGQPEDPAGAIREARRSISSCSRAARSTTSCRSRGSAAGAPGSR